LVIGVLEKLRSRQFYFEKERKFGSKRQEPLLTGEENMVGELNILTAWIPEQMEPGTVFVLENAGEIGEKEDPYWAVLACPSCGMLGLITRKQINGLLPVICGSEHCSAQFFIRDAEVIVRKPF
jgi:hypothetical protein